MVNQQNMRIRFTDFLRTDKEEIGLYVVQEAEASEFTIHLTNAESKEIISIKKTKDNWDILTHCIPVWIKQLKPMIATAIEYHWFVELFMKSGSGEKSRRPGPTKFPGR